MSIPHRAVTALCFAAAVAAQQSPDKDKDPLAMVARAEALLKAKEPENAILVLWDALAVVATLPKNAINDSVTATARQLLAANDTLDARRRTVFASVSRQQVELAALYRGKKWFDVAATRLAVADRYDADVAARERTLLEGAKPKGKPESTGTKAPAAPASKLAPLLRKGSTDFVYGEWKEIDDVLEVSTAVDGVAEWISSSLHEDHELVVEFRPMEPTKDHNLRLGAGLDMESSTRTYAGYMLDCQYHPASKNYSVALTRRRENKVEDLAVQWTTATPEVDGFHRLSMQVKGRRIRAQLGAGKALEFEAGADVRGRAGLGQGLTGLSSTAVQFRNFRIDPLPADMPSDEELRAKRATENQNAITKDVDAAKDLIEKKQPEPASTLLRQALARIRTMAPGILRDNLEKSVEQRLTQIDPFTARRKKAAQTIGAELVVLADEYEKAGMARAAAVVVDHALDFDPTLTAREAAADEAVRKWNAAQAAARASELAPPDDDGALLREWFAKGRPLFGNGPAFVFDGAVARAENLTDTAAGFWTVAPAQKPLAKSSVYVRLPANGAQAGLCFDIVDSSHFGLVQLHRTANGIHLESFLRVGNRWTQLMRQEVPMDEWRRDAWHRLNIDADGIGLVAHCNGVRIQTPRNLLSKQTGVLALYASNETKQPMTIELRAFAPQQ